MNWLNIAILLVAVGVASDNLVIAGWGGDFLTGMCKEKFMLILLFFFVLQIEMLLLGSNIAVSTELYRTRHEMAVIFLAFNAVLMCTKIITGTNEDNSSFKVSEIFKLIFNTSMYVLLWSLALHWLDIQESSFIWLLPPLVLLFIAMGLFLGTHHYNRVLKIFRWLAILLMITGTAILSFKTI